MQLLSALRYRERPVPPGRLEATFSDCALARAARHHSRSYGNAVSWAVTSWCLVVNTTDRTGGVNQKWEGQRAGSTDGCRARATSAHDLSLERAWLAS